MTGRHYLTGVVVLIVGGCAPVGAETSRANPYGKLFKPQDLKVVAVQQTQPERGRQTRADSRAIIPMDPCVDPRIFVNRRPNCH